MDSITRPVLLSGIQPSGHLTVGNYIGAMKSWVELQKDYDCFLVLVDLHAITLRQDPEELLRRSYDFIALYVACGIDPERATIFVQSHVSGHCELAWILNCFTSMGELKRMTQFKDKASKSGEGLNAGLFDYPVLMASDILLYGTNLVPIGDDQRQHLELTRNIALRFNRRFGDVFTIPECYMPKVGARIMSLSDPTSKMSKSDENPNNYIALVDEPSTIRKKVGKAMTDSGDEISYDESKPGISNLVVIYASVSGEAVESIQERYAGKGYGLFKKDLTEVLVECLRPIRERYASLREDQTTLHSMLMKGAETARQHSLSVLERVHGCLGFIPRHNET